MTDRDAADGGESNAAGESTGVRCWLVERTLDDRNLVTLVYATPEGDRYLRRERNAASLRAGDAPTAAIEADPESLEPVEDGSTRERYATEATRVAAAHDPDDPI
ncbi:hypothetical protein [Halovivax limisalsi]|uniref:hypothetical protein n=1 Tax=Halovivax limisalsi TaxID=1453760 RepID=UPI001FFD898F|nr:hypothetical protein [Halovivax limisalsi]